MVATIKPLNVELKSFPDKKTGNNVEYAEVLYKWDKLIAYSNIKDTETIKLLIQNLGKEINMEVEMLQDEYKNIKIRLKSPVIKR